MQYADIPTFFHLASLFRRDIAITKNFYTAQTLNSDFVSLLSLADKGNFIVSDIEAGHWNFNDVSATSKLNEQLKEKAMAAIKDMVNNYSFTEHEKQIILHELLFVSNYYYTTSMKGSMAQKLKHLFRYRKMKLYYLKGIAKILINRS